MIFMGVYVLVARHDAVPYAGIVYPEHDIVHDYENDEVIPEKSQDEPVTVQYSDNEIIYHAFDFACDCVVAPKTAPGNHFENEDISVLLQFIYTEIVPPIYDSVRDFSNGFAVVGMGRTWNEEEWRWERGLYGLIDKEGNLVLPIIYDRIGDIADTVSIGNCVVIIATYDGKRGVVNVHGDEILPFIFTRVSIRENFAVVNYGTGDDRTAGLFNLLTHEFVIPKGIYVAISDFISEYRTWVTLGPENYWQWGVVDINSGELLTPMVYSGRGRSSSPDWFNNGVAVARDVCGGRKTGLLDANGNEITRFIYDDIFWLCECILHVHRNGRWGIVSIEGNYILEPVFDYRMWLYARGEGLRYSAVWQDGLMGIWDVIEGRMIIPNIYLDIAGIYNNYAIVRYGDWSVTGVLNIETGEYIIPLGYMTFGANTLDNSITPASIGTEGYDLKMGLVDIQTGEVIVDFIYNDLRWANSGGGGFIIFQTGAEWERRVWDGGEFYALAGGLFGVMDVNGNIIIPAIYSFISYMHNSQNLFVVGLWGEQDGMKMGVINSAGEIVLPIVYTHVGSFFSSSSFPAYLASVNIGAELVWDNSANLYDNSGDYVLRGGKWGFIGIYGNLVVPAGLEYDLVYPVVDGMAAVMRDGLWGFLSVIPDV